MTEPEQKNPEDNKALANDSAKDAAKNTAKNSAEKKTVKPKQHKTGSSHAGVYTLLFFIVLATSGGFYTLWENQQQFQLKQIISSQRIDQELDNLKKQQTETATQYETRLQTLQTAQDNLFQNLTNLIRDKKHLRNDWLLAEAEYLVQLANHRLLLEKDVATALVALKAADARLAEVTDPALLAIRKILKNDIIRLNNIPTVDQAGLSITLSALSNNIQNLPLRTPDPKTHKITSADKPLDTPDVKSIKELPAAIWRDIKSLIVIRRHDKPVEPLLAPDQHFFLEQNLGLLLEQSRLALLNGQNKIYQDRLQATAKWIAQFFDTEHNVTRNMLASIEELTKFDIDPALPDISSTFSAIQKYRLQGQQPAEVTEKADVK